MRRTMKRSRNLVALLLVVVFTIGIASPVVAQIPPPYTYNFEHCTFDDPAHVATGEAQLSVIVTLLAHDRIRFRFENTGPNASSLTDIYFHDPLDDFLQFISFNDSGSGVAFAEGALPPVLLGGQGCPPLPNVANGFGIVTESADSNNPVIANGINPGEWLEIEMKVAPEVVWGDVVSGLSTGMLRIGVILQFNDGTNESFSNAPQPTYIQLEAFTVTPTDEGVAVQWATATEIDNAGFNLYRASTLAGPYEKINSQLIAAVGAAAHYEYVDTEGNAGDFYRLEDIDLNGVATRHVPIKAKAAQLNRFVFIPMVQSH